MAFTAHWEEVAERASVLADLQSQGFVRLLAQGELLNLGQSPREQLAEQLPRQGSVLVIVDRLRGGDARWHGPPRASKPPLPQVPTRFNCCWTAPTH